METINLCFLGECSGGLAVLFLYVFLVGWHEGACFGGELKVGGCGTLSIEFAGRNATETTEDIAGKDFCDIWNNCLDNSANCGGNSDATDGIRDSTNDKFCECAAWNRIRGERNDGGCRHYAATSCL